MILRNVTWSEQVRALPSPVSPSSSGVATSLFTEHDKSAQSVPAALVAESPMTIERVLHWLDMQDESARAILAEMLAPELDALRARAIAEGQQLGLAQGAQQVEDKFKQVFDALQVLSTSYEKMFAQRIEMLADTCVPVVDEALSKLLTDAFRMPGASLKAVHAALARVTGARDILVRVNQCELEVLNSKHAELAYSLGIQAFRLIADERVTSGGCLVESSFGEIDARWESQLEVLIQTLRTYTRESGEPR